jgi:glycosyltransferase involved in cell wall biosynthesis
MRAPRRVNLLLAESGRSVGGTERVVWELATRLHPDRWAVRVWLSPDPGVDELAAALADAEVPVDRVAEVDSRRDLEGMWRTFRALRRAKPDILHIHHVWPAADRYLSEIAAWAGVSHQVVTEHIVGRSHSGAQRALKRRELARADAVTAVCGAVADALSRELGVSRERFTLVPNGADGPAPEQEGPESRRLRLELRADPRRPLLVAVGRLEEQKGMDVLLEAVASLAGRGLDFVVAVAGDGSWRERLERTATGAGIESRVRWMGRVPDPGPLMLAADVFVLPSRWEGLPLTLLEAMARGRAVVASSVGGIPEVVADGENGVLVPAGDAGALASALERIIESPALRQKLGEGARESVERGYTWDGVVEAFETIYDEVLGLASFERSRPERPPRPSPRGHATPPAADGKELQP